LNNSGIGLASEYDIIEAMNLESKLDLELPETIVFLFERRKLDFSKTKEIVNYFKGKLRWRNTTQRRSITNGIRLESIGANS
jgi:hypothetical protein